VICSAATLKPLVAGKRGVVAAGHPLVAEAGLRIFEKGVTLWISEESRSDLLSWTNRERDSSLRSE
jgi:hypothetical protein